MLKILFFCTLAHIVLGKCACLLLSCLSVLRTTVYDQEIVSLGTRLNSVKSKVPGNMCSIQVLSCGHPYHTECVSQLVDHFKAIKKSYEKTGNVPNLSKGGGGGTPPLVKNQTISGFFIWRFSLAIEIIFISLTLPTSSLAKDDPRWHQVYFSSLGYKSWRRFELHLSRELNHFHA